MRPNPFAETASRDLRERIEGPRSGRRTAARYMPVMTMESDQPTAREILDAVLHSHDVLAEALRRVEADVAVLKADVAVLKADVVMLKAEMAIVKSDVKTLGESLYRLERRVIRIDDRLSSIEDLRLRSVLDDHERRIGRLEGF